MLLRSTRLHASLSLPHHVNSDPRAQGQRSEEGEGSYGRSSKDDDEETPLTPECRVLPYSGYKDNGQLHRK